MKTKDLIKDKGRELFNRKGVMFVTLRDVAKALHKSYGNITYHYPNKEVLILNLYSDMMLELRETGNMLLEGVPTIEKLLDAPAYTFDISLKYLFLHKDYVDILRNNPEVAKASRTSNEQRKVIYFDILNTLKDQGVIMPELKDEDLNYLMELSGAMRTFFFIQLSAEDLKKPNLKQDYIRYVNRLLYPYLSQMGRVIYDQYFIRLYSE